MATLTLKKASGKKISFKEAKSLSREFQEAVGEIYSIESNARIAGHYRRKWQIKKRWYNLAHSENEWPNDNLEGALLRKWEKSKRVRVALFDKKDIRKEEPENLKGFARIYFSESEMRCSISNRLSKEQAKRVWDIIQDNHPDMEKL